MRVLSAGYRGASRCGVTATLVLVVACARGGAPQPEEAKAEVEPSVAAASESRVAEFVGTWVAQLSHAGSTETFVLELTPNADGSIVRGFVSVPAIDLWRSPSGTATMAPDGLRVGSLRLRFEDDPPRLLGTVPSSLVPVHTIPLELHRGEEVVPERAAPRNIPDHRPVWTFATQAEIWAGVAAHANTVFVGSDDGWVYAIDHLGAERWRFLTAGKVRAAPSVQGGSVWVHSDDGYLYQLGVERGDLIWRARLGPEVVRPPFGAQGFRYDHYASSPVVADGRVFVGHDREFHALSAADGTPIWSVPLSDITTSTPVVMDGRVFFGAFDGSVYALEAETGALVWAHDTGAPVPSSPAWHDGRVIVGSRSYDLFAFDAEAGSVGWRFYNWFSWVESSPVVEAGTVFVGSSDRQRLNAIDATSGRQRWSFDSDGSVWAAPAVGNDLVFVGAVGVAGYVVDHQGAFFAVDMHNGQPSWQFTVSQRDGEALWGFGASPAFLDGLVVAAGLDGVVYAFPSR